ncbi:hypothetical protein CASFOL_041044 [Castilleja foliolosa]|uniref:F-box domain-containing protein n=1 Tax=Castilleja foliolosa TaxID=1961234 RepID=A0ABD3BDC0_9LAMI
MSITDSGSEFAARDELEKDGNGVTIKTNEEEGNSEIHVPEKRVEVKNGRSHLRSCKRLESNINSLPDEIVFDILVRIPAQDIYSAVRTVCRKWYQMIHTNKFVKTHLHHSTCVLLLQKRVSQSTELTFMSLSRQGQIELTRLNYKPEHSLWCSSSNGLILECDSRKDGPLYIANPVTMQRFSLPPTTYGLAGLGFCFSAIAYASLSMEYKVVKLYLNREDNQLGCIILTVGVDESWRPICTQHLSLEAKENLTSSPLTTEGFLHWAKGGNYVLTLNVETEIITEYPVPPSGARVYYLSTLKYLSMLIGCAGWSWEVWEMKPETGEWTQLPGIDLEDRMCDIFEIFGGLRERDKDKPYGSFAYIRMSLFPIGWLKYKEVLLYCLYCPHTGQQLSTCMAWNIRLREIEFIELDSNMNGFFVHRNSLLWLDGC